MTRLYTHPHVSLPTLGRSFKPVFRREPKTAKRYGYGKLDVLAKAVMQCPHFDQCSFPTVLATKSSRKISEHQVPRWLSIARRN